MKRRFVLSRVPRTCSVRPSDPSCSPFEGVLPARSANFSYLGCYAFRIGCLSAPVQVVLWENQKLQVVSGNDCTNGLHCIDCSGSICRNELALICFFLSYSHCSSFPNGCFPFVIMPMRRSFLESNMLPRLLSSSLFLVFLSCFSC